MAFRYEGVNWEGRDWQTVPAVTALGRKVESVREGDFAVDGTVASRAHDYASPRSDHRPDSEGDVFAIDFGGDDGWLAGVSERMRVEEDPRIKYMIHRSRICSSYPMGGYEPWVWRAYSGVPHDHHIHVSVTDEGADDGSDWVIGNEEDEVQFTEAEATALKAMVANMRAEGSTPAYVTETIRLIRRERQLPLHEAEEGGVGEDPVARLGVEANAVEITNVKETLRSV